MAMDKPSEFKQLLGFDFGTSRIGVAFGQSITQSCGALAEIPARDGIPSWDDIEKLIKEYQPEAFIIGLPLNMDGSESQMSMRARKFAKRLHGRFGPPSFMWDERLTSSEAKAVKPSDNYKKNAVDAIAASVILQSWLDNGCQKIQP